MRIRTVSILCILSSLLFYSCNPNFKRVIISGFVKDQKDRTPIMNADVKIEYWTYNPQISESEKFIKRVKTDNKGHFSLELKELEAIDLIINAANYKTEKKSYTVRSSKIDDVFFLQKQESL
jgi:hypothetical protein